MTDTQTKSSLWNFFSPTTNVVIILVVVAGLVAGGMRLYSGIQNARQAAAYHAKMSTVLDEIPSASFLTGDCLVAYDSAAKQYTDKYIPEALRTDDPAQVRAVVRFSHGSTPVGTYGSSGTGYRRTMSMDMKDAATGGIIPGTMHTISGGEPPRSSVSNGITKKDQYGSHVSESDVTQWVKWTWENLSYHLMMSAAFDGDQPLPTPAGNMLVYREHNGRYTRDMLPDEMAADTPEEVCAILQYSEESGTDLDTSMPDLMLNWTDITFQFIDPATGEPMPDMTKTVRGYTNLSKAELRLPTSVRSQMTLDEAMQDAGDWVFVTWLMQLGGLESSGL